jgi:FkbM family methyltransferase
VLSRALFNVVCSAGTFLCRRRGRPLVDRFTRAADCFHRCLHNVNLEMKDNGELRVLRRLAVLEPKYVFDVGANEGEWSRMAAQLYPACTIHAFEIVPSTCEELVRNTRGLPGLVINNFGLSDETGQIAVSLAGDDSKVATGCKVEGMRCHEEYYQRQLLCPIRRASDYLAETGLACIDFVKIDVEGMDLKVIRGFADRLRIVRALQFEYGGFNVASRDLLRDCYRYLTDRGFVVGKVFPRCVDFFEYHYSRENFYVGNYLAVRADEKAFIDSVARFGA